MRIEGVTLRYVQVSKTLLYDVKSGNQGLPLANILLLLKCEADLMRKVQKSIFFKKTRFHFIMFASEPVAICSLFVLEHWRLEEFIGV